MGDDGWVFVYGLLKGGFRLARHPVLEAARQEVRSAKVRGELYDLGGYPGLRRGEGWVEGEVHHFSRVGEVLEVMDEMEGYDPRRSAESLYVRELVDAILDSGEGLQAWVYYYNYPVERACHLPEGIWPPSPENA